MSEEDQLPSDLSWSMQADAAKSDGASDQLLWHSRRWDGVLKARRFQEEIFDLKAQVRLRWRADGDPNSFDPDTLPEDSPLQGLFQIAQTRNNGQK